MSNYENGLKKYENLAKNKYENLLNKYENLLSKCENLLNKYENLHYARNRLSFLISSCLKLMPSRLQLSLEKVREAWEYLLDNPERTTGEMREALGLSEATAYRLARKFSQSASLSSFLERGRRTGRPPKCSVVLRARIRDILEGDASLTLRGVRRLLRHRFRTRVSIPTVAKAIKAMGWSRKRLLRMPEARNSARVMKERKDYAAFTGPRNDTMLLFLDECGVNLHTSSSYGWAPVGVRPVATVPTQRGQSISVVVTISAGGDVIARLFDGPVNGGRLKDYLNQDLFPVVDSWPAMDRLLVMDNAKFHHAPV